MRIGIDIRAITSAGLGRGLGIYTAQLVENLLSIDIDPQNHYTLFAGKDQPIDGILSQAASPEQVEIIRLRRPTRSIFLWDQLFWGMKLRRERIDLFHSPVYGVPFVCACQRVLTIHDLTPLIFPEFLKKFRHRAVFRFNFLTAKSAEKIITASQNSQKDIMRYLRIPERKIAVIPDGVSPVYRKFHDARYIEAIKTRYHLPGKYLLYVGGFDDNKNLRRLVEAFDLLLHAAHFSETELVLVLAGAINSAAVALREFIAERQMSPRVILTGFVPESDLVGLYNGAEAFVFPSLYEGFGLPPLEAMACGAPVIVSNASSLPEVVGDAGIQVNPHSSQELSQAIAEMLTNHALRHEMQQKGLERAQRFSWQATARQTLRVYEEVGRLKN